MGTKNPLKFTKTDPKKDICRLELGNYRWAYDLETFLSYQKVSKETSVSAISFPEFVKLKPPCDYIRLYLA